MAPMEDWEVSIKTIDGIESLEILEKLLTNVIKNPSEKKFRNIKLTNPKIQKTIAECDGALETLLLTGWELEDCESVVLPEGIKVPDRVMGKILEQKKKLIGEGQVPTGTTVRATGTNTSNSTIPTQIVDGVIVRNAPPQIQGNGTSSPGIGGDVPVIAGATTASGNTKSSVVPKSAFQFQNKRAQEAEKEKAKQSLAELRAQKAAQFKGGEPRSRPVSSSMPMQGTRGATGSCSSTGDPMGTEMSEIRNFGSVNVNQFIGSASSKATVKANPSSCPVDSPNSTRKSGGGSRSPRDKTGKKAEDSKVEDLRALQREKFLRAQQNPELQAKALADQQAAGANNTHVNKPDEGVTWWNPGTWFGGGGGSGPSNPPPPPSRPSNNRGGARIRGVGDLPKPVQRG